jgi:hypothetical protein
VERVSGATEGVTWDERSLRIGEWKLTYRSYVWR